MNSNRKSENTTSSLCVLIPDADDWLTVKVLRCLGQESNTASHILSKNKKPLSRYSKYCKSFHHNNSQDEKSWVDEIIRLVKELQVNVILPVTLKGVELVSRNRKTISEFVQIPALAKPEQIELVNDKWAFHKFISQHKFLSIPTVYAGHSGEDINVHEIDSIEFPALLKPASEAGGFGIVKVEKAEDLKQAWRDNRIMKNHQYVIQSYVPGVDICLQVFCKEGKITAYTIQKSLSVSDDYFGPQRYMEFVMNQEILSLGEKIVSAICWDGIACIDFRVDSRNGKTGILEINPRYGQAILGSIAAGVNFPLIACYSALNMEYPHKYRKTRYAHPVPSAQNFIYEIIGKKTIFSKQRWSESGLKFTYIDPMPEVLDFANKIIDRLRRKLSRKHLL